MSFAKRTADTLPFDPLDRDLIVNSILCEILIQKNILDQILLCIDIVNETCIHNNIVIGPFTFFSASEQFPH